MSNKLILIIDDEPYIREVVHLCLSAIGGYEVVEAASGQEGILKAIEKRPDAIVLDLCMPEMDGIAVLEQLQNHPITRVIPVVILSAVASQVDRPSAFKRSVVDTISKPFDPLTLSKQIATACQWY
jgi:CheY-like chemotaxis protein